MKKSKLDTKPVFTLKKLIKDAGLTQRELAQKTGIKEVTVNSWVAGKRMPTFDNAVIIAKAINCDLKTLAESLGIDTQGIPEN